MNKYLLIPLVLFIGLAAFLFVGLSRDPRELPSALINKPAPDFQLPDETGHVRSLADYHGKILILAFYPKDFTGG